jgi:hypothetical protein
VFEGQNKTAPLFLVLHVTPKSNCARKHVRASMHIAYYIPPAHEKHTTRQRLAAAAKAAYSSSM